MNEDKLRILVDYLETLSKLNGHYKQEINRAIYSIERELGIQKNRTVASLTPTISVSEEARVTLKDVIVSEKESPIATEGFLADLESAFKNAKSSFK